MAALSGRDDCRRILSLSLPLFVCTCFLFARAGQVSKRFNLCTSTSFGDPRLTLVHEDAAEFVKKEVRI